MQLMMASEQRPQTLSCISEVSAHTVPQPRVTKEQQSEQLVDDDDDADGGAARPGGGGCKGSILTWAAPYFGFNIPKIIEA